MIEAFDAETLESCYAPLQIELKDGTVINKITPCLVPEHNLISRISSTSPRYWPVTCSGERLRAVLAHRGLCYAGLAPVLRKRSFGPPMLARISEKSWSWQVLRVLCWFHGRSSIAKVRRISTWFWNLFSVGDEDDNIQMKTIKVQVSDGVFALSLHDILKWPHDARNTLILRTLSICYHGSLIRWRCKIFT